MIQSPAGYQGDVRIKRYLDFYQAGYGVSMLSFGTAFSPLSLFAASEPGVWYDPSDMTTLFQDAAGTTPVTAVEQPVGLVLDKSRGLALGAELVTNGDFSGGTTGWSASTGATLSGSISATGGLLTLTVTGSSAAGVYQGVSTTVGKRYKVTVKTTSLNTNANQVVIRKADTADFGAMTNDVIFLDVLGNLGIGTFNGSFVATATTSYIYVQRNGNGNTITVDDVTVRELPGSHASQATSASRPVLSARYNLLTKTEGAFNASPWTKVNTTITDSTSETADPFGGSVASKVVETSATGLHEFYNNTGISFAGTNIISIYAKPSTAAGARTWIAMDYFTGSGNVTWFNLTGSGSVGTNASGNTSTITAVGGGWYHCTITRTATLTAFAAKIAESDGVVSYAGDTGKFMYFFGADVRVSNDGVGLPAYQRVNTSTDYDTAGFPMYLRFDGTDDSLATGSIDFTSTDKMSLFAGVRKLSDAAQGIIAELSANGFTNNGAFYISFPNAGGNSNYVVALRGDSSAFYLPQTFAAPITNVASISLDISGASIATEIVPRFNGTVTQTNPSGAAGTGNFGNYPLYIGRRNNSSLPLNGRLYSLLVVGRATTSAEIASTETWVNSKTRAY